MTDERYPFEAARVRLEEIATLARKKDTSLEKSLDLLEEGVRLANICTELVDHTDLSATVAVEAPEPTPLSDVVDGTNVEAAVDAEVVAEGVVDMPIDAGPVEQ